MCPVKASQRRGAWGATSCSSSRRERREVRRAGVSYNWLHFFPLTRLLLPPICFFFYKGGGGEKREGWVRVEHPGPLGNKGRVHTCLLLNRLLASFTAVFTRRCYKLLSPFISARLEVMNQSVSRNGEKNLSKITYSLRDDNILWKSVIWMYCCFENALKNVSFYFKGVYLRFKPLFWHLDAGNNSGTDLNFHWHTLDMLKVCQEVDGLPGNVGWRRDGANKRALIHTAGLGLTGPVRD